MSSKLTTCKVCGGRMAKTAKVCPHCGAKVKLPPVVTAIIVVIVIFMVLFTLNSIGKISDAMKEESEKQQSTQSLSTAIKLAENDYISAEFIGFDDADFINTLYVNIRFHNKTNQKLWLYLNDASINNTTMQAVMTGTPVYVLPFQDAIGSYIFTLGQVGLSSCSEVNSVSFRMVIADPDSLHTISSTDIVTVSK